MTRIKFCGMRELADVELAAELGVDLVGFVLEPSSPRYVPDVWPLMALRTVAPLTPFVGVLGSWIEGCDLRAFEFLQCEENVAVRTGLRQLLTVRPRPGSTLVSLLRELDGPAGRQNVWHRPLAVVLDTYRADRQGGTGEVGDWELAGQLARTRPVVLAGGLTPGNVADAVRRVKPYGVDVSSGIESRPGVKDHGKMRAFVEAVRSVG